MGKVSLEKVRRDARLLLLLLSSARGGGFSPSPLLVCGGASPSSPHPWQPGQGTPSPAAPAWSGQAAGCVGRVLRVALSSIVPSCRPGCVGPGSPRTVLPGRGCCDLAGARKGQGGPSSRGQGARGGVRVAEEPHSPAEAAARPLGGCGAAAAAAAVRDLRCRQLRRPLHRGRPAASDTRHSPRSPQTGTQHGPGRCWMGWPSLGLCPCPHVPLGAQGGAEAAVWGVGSPVLPLPVTLSTVAPLPRVVWGQGWSPEHGLPRGWLAGGCPRQHRPPVTPGPAWVLRAVLHPQQRLCDPRGQPGAVLGVSSKMRSLERGERCLGPRWQQ